MIYSDLYFGPAWKTGRAKAHWKAMEIFGILYESREINLHIVCSQFLVKSRGWGMFTRFVDFPDKMPRNIKIW